MSVTPAGLNKLKTFTLQHYALHKVPPAIQHTGLNNNPICNFAFTLTLFQPEVERESYLWEVVTCPEIPSTFHIITLVYWASYRRGRSDSGNKLETRLELTTSQALEMLQIIHSV